MAHIRCGFCQRFLLEGIVRAAGLIASKLAPTGAALFM
ncbi:hypothetical protein C4K05_0622 [Pseudomonas chlororaphis subsp. aureofaciens]|uniref:Uncharacterized protein n=1 Tax=Pseudomonas chlororaphis subsp. aureofaciens TaxID=587851 RepID=A0AAD1E400_9PSED|nr:hypothetical protein C4K10_0600 [Pseudomonas chlororaphis subsp. aureofaciens]AZE21053.1 hypothetical protein C4K08_0599 [Pseudomonas chlororaphis subsp. aureofaciens]AZE27407.1 hypothetical protein C4K07_0595 [Pseudomonas chlororaphis subsp. aureofaciens]AZE33655.1 hypothetical protein C4K06_0595 [Pseudomonas chlororaphis subsp. aureofaciens]AZE39989.1 hypothetical protein C4K05_0622 [Pseudomonas chlororaphis subsp. aureofaciens]